MFASILTMTAQATICIGAAIIATLGAAHLVFTLQSRPDRGPLTPTDPQIQAALKIPDGLGMAPDINQPLWRAWVGFNLSHSVGVFVVGLLIGLPALLDFDEASGNPLWLTTALLLPYIYLTISIRHWFSKPTSGIATSAALITVGVLLIAVT